MQTIEKWKKYESEETHKHKNPSLENLEFLFCVEVMVKSWNSEVNLVLGFSS